jgi:hypothetical protein
VAVCRGQGQPARAAGTYTAADQYADGNMPAGCGRAVRLVTFAITGTYHLR